MENINNLCSFSYKEIEPLTDNIDGPILVRSNDTKEFFVKKCYPLYLKDNLITLQKIKQNNLPEIQEIVIEENRIYLYEEFIHGKTLTEIIKSSDRIETKMILEQTLSLLNALIALHDKGLVHRDVKPGNIMLTNDGVLKLIDFDAVRVFDGTKETDTVQLGTIGFAAPEQFGFAESDERSDLYSVGVVVNICSTKEYPKNQLSSDPFLRDMIIKATRLDPKNRYQSALEMQADVKEKRHQLEKSERTNQLHYFKNSHEHIEVAEQTNGKRPIRSFLRNYVPGFRTNQPWKMTLAIIYYVFMSIGLPANILEGGTNTERLLLALDRSIMFLLPVLLFTNFMNFYEKIPVLNSKNILLRSLGYVLLVVSWMLYYELFLFITNGGAKG